jgi:hypothetical protein
VKRSFHEESEGDGPLLGSPVNDTRSGTTLGAGSLGHAMLLATDLENVVQAFLGRLSSLWRMSRCRPPGRTFCRGVVSHGCVFFKGSGRDWVGLPRENKSRQGVWVASEAAKIARGQDCDSRPFRLCRSDDLAVNGAIRRLRSTRVRVAGEE